MIGAILTLIQDEARRIWCHRWLGLAVAAVILVAGLGYVMSIPNVYDAWGQVFVNKQTPVAAAARSVSLDSDGFASAGVVQKTLLNDQNLERWVRQINPGAAHMDRAEMAAAVADLRQRIRISADDDGFVDFHYTDSDPALAARMVKRLMNQFVAVNVDRSRGELNKAAAFLDDQIAGYKGQLAESQARINALRASHAGLAVLPASEAETATEEVLVNNGPSPARQAQAAKASAAAERVAGLEAKLDQLREVYTDQYPDVISVRRQLADAVAAQALQGGLRPAAKGESVGAAGPAVRRVVHRARPQPIIPPAVAADWADAQRNAEVLRTNYQQLTARREATRMSMAVFGSDSLGKFQVTRTPTAPITPIGPRRVLFIAIVVAGALTAGLAAAYLRGAFRGIMVSPRELELACQLPVIGTVSWEPAWSTAARRRDRSLSRTRRDAPKPRRPALRWLGGAKSMGDVR